VNLTRCLSACWLTLISMTSAGAMAEDAGPVPLPAGSAPAAAPDAATQPIDAAAVEADIASQQLSAAAQVRLDAARDAVVQIRGFYGGSDASAFHGSGFAVADGTRIVTNYHVVAPAVLYPRQYRLEYTAADGRRGRLQVQAIDVRNDLAIARAEDLELPPLRLRTGIPAQGERAYSIGFPLDLGLTITEGVANGLVDGSLEQRIHYTGPINGGMSGGPALDANGRVYGVNVSVVTGRQLIGFVVPAKHVAPLLTHAHEPLDLHHSERQLRELVAAQVLAYEAEILTPLAAPAARQTLQGYTLPARISSQVECHTSGDPRVHPRLRVGVLRCAIPSRLMLQFGLVVGGLSMQHQVVRSRALRPLQFARWLNRLAEAPVRTGSALHVAPFACRDALVSLDGFDARVTTCIRQYRLFAGLHDFDVTVVGIDDPRQAIVSRLALQGFGFAPGMQVVERYLGAMQWTR
jgi:S1-C subfamily serine protease